MRSLVWIVFVLFPILISGQDTYLRFAFTGDIGTKFRRGGLLFQITQKAGRGDRFEFYSAVQLKFVQRGMGPQKNSTEMSIHAGAAVAMGKWNYNNFSGNYYVPFSFLTTHGRRSQLAYTFNYYMDHHKTTQGTGTITIKVGNTYIISENDLFGNLDGKDRFRTGSLGLYLRKDKFFAGLKTTLWTGETRCSEMKRVKDSMFPGRYGYKDIEPCTYANFSHGLLSLESGYMHSDFFMPALRIGKDDERIRNFVQNEIIHDMHFIPSKWNTAQNLHIPMLDTEGKAYLYKEDQELKKGKFFLQLAVNHSWFY